MFQPSTERYRLDTWPVALGFVFDPALRFWVRGKWSLARLSAKEWELSHPEQKPRRLRTPCRFPGSIAQDLSDKLRDALDEFARTNTTDGG